MSFSWDGNPAALGKAEGGRGEAIWVLMGPPTMLGPVVGGTYHPTPHFVVLLLLFPLSLIGADAPLKNKT